MEPITILVTMCFATLASASAFDILYREIPDAHWWTIGALGIIRNLIELKEMTGILMLFGSFLLLRPRFERRAYGAVSYLHGTADRCRIIPDTGPTDISYDDVDPSNDADLSGYVQIGHPRRWRGCEMPDIHEHALPDVSRHRSGHRCT